MTSRNTLKRQIRSRMQKTGESYSAARRHFRTAKDSSMNTQELENPRTRIAKQMQSELWPDWVEKQPWLKSFLPRAEAEARNQGNLECDHFHLLLAFLRLPAPVPDWFIQLRVNVEQWKEDLLVTIGSNFQATDVQRYVAYGGRINKARKSKDPVSDVPLDSISSEAERMLNLARQEADRDGTTIDERHFMVPMMDWHPHGEPPLEELRRLTGRS